MQISNIQAGTGAGNVIPGQLDFKFNFRYSTEINADTLKQQVEALLDKQGINYSIKWRLNGKPFLSKPGKLVETTQDAIHQVVGIKPELSTSGGTSDARFIAPYGVEVLELGPVNASIHQVNEHTDLAELTQLQSIYFTIIKQLLG